MLGEEEMARHNSSRVAFLITVILFLISLFCSPAHAALKGGCAKVDITPPIGVWLSGYGGRDKPSDDIEDELYTKALVLDDGSETIAIITNDLLWVPLEITEKVRAIVREKVGIPEQNILICATHTHFGPKIFSETSMGPDVSDNTVDSAYVETLVKKMTDSVFLAHKNMQEVKFGAAKGEVPEVVFNRRPRREDGSVQTSFTLAPEVLATREIQHASDGSVIVKFSFPAGQPQLAFGPVDPTAWVLRVENMDGGIVGSFVNFACHPVSGSSYADWFYSISADYPGETMRVVEQVEGGVCLFALGTAGDIVPIRRGKEPRFEIGRAIGAEAVRRLQLVSVSDDISLAAATAQLELPLRQEPSPGSIMKAKEGQKERMTEIQVLKLGDVYILGLPGEILVEIGLEIKKRAGLEKLIIVSLSNDAVGYVCHAAAYDEGGYESESGTNLAKGAGEIMIEQALELISRVRNAK